jgi:hypothetical protein
MLIDDDACLAFDIYRGQPSSHAVLRKRIVKTRAAHHCRCGMAPDHVVPKGAHARYECGRIGQRFVGFYIAVECLKKMMLQA